MSRVYLPLLPLPLLAVIVAVSACSKARTEETTHVIPPAEAIVTPPVQARAPSPQSMVASRTEDEKPTAEDVKEFERPVKK